MTAPWSLRRRLIGLLATAALLSWAAGSLWLYRTARVEAESLFDAALIETAHSVLAVIAHEIRAGNHEEDEETEIELDAIDHRHTERLYFHVRRPGGELLFRSPGSPQAPLGGDTEGSRDRAVEGQIWRVYTLTDPRYRVSIDVAQPRAARDRIAQAIALRLLLPGIALMGLLALGAGAIVRRVTAPIVRYSERIDTRSPGDRAPVPADELPQEMRPVAQAIDRLLQRIDQALLHERTLTADAAHELRTPLAAMRAQAQVALRARDEAERRAALQTLMQGVDRAARSVDAVMSMARLDAAQIDRRELAELDLARLLALVAEEFRNEAAQRQCALQLDAGALLDRVDADAYALLLRNLIDNALRHARQTVRVELLQSGQHGELRVLDDGPGMPEDQRQRAFDRFYRASHGGGAGLGLALVRRVAELHQGSVGLCAGLGAQGFGVCVRWPLAR